MDRHFLFQQRTRSGPDGVDRRDWVVTFKHQSREAEAAGDDCPMVEKASIAEGVEYMRDHLGLPKKNDGESSLLSALHRVRLGFSCCLVGWL